MWSLLSSGYSRPFLIMAELACAYAAMILQDDGIEITADKMNKLINAAGVQIESYWVDLFAEYLKDKDVAALIKGSCGAAAAATTGAAAGAAEEAKEEEKREEEEVVEMAGGFDDLFG